MNTIILGGGQDFEDVSTTLEFNETVNSMCISFQTVDSFVYENDEMLSLQLSSLDSTVSFDGLGQTAVTIFDDDSGFFFQLNSQ